MATADCCALSATPQPEPSAVAAVSVAFDLVLQGNSPLDASPARLARREDQRRKPPQLPPQPLYTLHSALLI